MIFSDLVRGGSRIRVGAAGFGGGRIQVCVPAVGAVAQAAHLPLVIDHVDVRPERASPPTVLIVGRLPSRVRVTIAANVLDPYQAALKDVRFHGGEAAERAT